VRQYARLVAREWGEVEHERRQDRTVEIPADSDRAPTDRPPRTTAIATPSPSCVSLPEPRSILAESGPIFLSPLAQVVPVLEFLGDVLLRDKGDALC
jgi:hypothetical protein